jgi:AcrR family transcriptional regulator
MIATVRGIAGARFLPLRLIDLHNKLPFGVRDVYGVIMSDKANGVNIENRRYHHGDLRAAVIAAALRLLADRDAEAFSLREVARAVGVSPTAVYRHFPDKDALMAAVAEEGLAQLAASQRAASSQAGGGAAGFAATGQAYVRFALANPALFRLMFGTPARSGWGKALQSRHDATAYLKTNAAAAAAAEPNGPSGPVLEVKAWALVHGLAMLMLDGQIPSDDGLIQSVIAGMDRG